MSGKRVSGDLRFLAWGTGHMIGAEGTGLEEGLMVIRVLSTSSISGTKYFTYYLI